MGRKLKRIDGMVPNTHRARRSKQSRDHAVHVRWQLRSVIFWQILPSTEATLVPREGKANSERSARTGVPLPIGPGNSSRASASPFFFLQKKKNDGKDVGAMGGWGSLQRVSNRRIAGLLRERVRSSKKIEPPISVVGPRQRSAQPEPLGCLSNFEPLETCTKHGLPLLKTKFRRVCGPSLPKPTP